MEIDIDLTFAHSTALIEANCPNQFPRQLPISLYIDTETSRVWAEAKDNSQGMPEREWNGIIKTFPLPCNVDADKLQEWGENTIAPLARLLISAIEAGEETGTLEEHAIEGVCCAAPTSDSALWDTGEWLQEWDELRAITPDTTDDELEALVSKAEDLAAYESVVLDGDVLEFLEEERANA